MILVFWPFLFFLFWGTKPQNPAWQTIILNTAPQNYPKKNICQNMPTTLTFYKIWTSLLLLER